MSFRVQLLDISRIDEYEQVSSAYLVDRRVTLSDQGLHVDPLDAYWKDYDAVEDERPRALAERLPVDRFRLLAAEDSNRVIAGAMLAWETAAFPYLPYAQSACTLADLRVDPMWRGKGIARSLIAATCELAKSFGRRTMWVETQDVNVPAYRCYVACGFEVSAWEPDAYRPANQDVRILLNKALDIGS